MAILRNVIIWCCFLSPVFSYAGTIPATAKTAGQSTIAATQGHQGPGPSGAVVYDTFGQACDAVRTYPYGVLPKGNCTDAPSGNPWSNGGTSGVCYYNNGGSNCAGMTSSTPTMAYKCPAGYTGSTPGWCVNTTTIYTCPAGYTGPTLINGVQSCVNGCDETTVGTAQVWANAWAVSSKLDSASLIGPKTVPSVGCSGSCEIANESFTACHPQGSPSVDVPAPIYCTLTGKQTGNSCTSNPVPGTPPTISNHPPKCLPTEGVLTSSSGTVACVPAGTPAAEAPVVRTEKQVQQFTDGSTRTTETTYTKDPATGVQDTKQTITNTPATGGGAGQAGPVGTSSVSGSSQPGTGTEKSNAKFCEENAQLQICQGDMNKEETQKQVRDYIKSLTDPGSTAYTAIETAKQSTQADADLQAEIDKFTAATGGTYSPNAASKSSWESAMGSGWFEPVTRQGCSPYSAQIGGRTWTLDICPTAEKISVISEYVLWFLLVVGTFVMLTGGAISKGS